MKKISLVLLATMIAVISGFYQDWNNKEAIATIPVVEDIVFPECGITIPRDIEKFKAVLAKMNKSCRFGFANYNELTQEHYELLKAYKIVVAVNFLRLIFYKSALCVSNCLEYNRDKPEGECLYSDWKPRIDNWVADNPYLLDSDVFKWFNPHDEANNGCASTADQQTIIDELSDTVLKMPVALSYEGGPNGGDLPAVFPTGADCIHLFQNIQRELGPAFQADFDIVKQVSPYIIVGRFISHDEDFQWEPTREDMEFVIDNGKQFCMDNLPNCVIFTGAAPAFSPQGNTALALGVDFNLLHPVYPLSFPEFSNGPQPTPSPTPMPTQPPTGFSPGVLSITPGIAGQINTFSVSGATPGSTVEIFWSFNYGTAQACDQSKTFGITNPRGTNNILISVDGNGNGSIGVSVGTNANGATLLFQGEARNGAECDLTPVLSEVF